jgi:hypothetical protein
MVLPPLLLLVPAATPGPGPALSRPDTQHAIADGFPASQPAHP